MSFCNVPPMLRQAAPLLFRRRQKESEDHRGGRVDRHRSRDLIERDAVEEHFHIFARRDGYAALADLAFRKWMVGVIAHQRRQIEGCR
jgi:hypothetical protein